MYALGVVLYELVAGALPWRETGQAHGDLAERRATSGHLPERLSSRIARDGRASDARTVRLELDWVAARALEPLPERRYASAAEFADELERFVRGEGVRAGPPSLTHRVRRFCRGHRLAVTVAGAMIAVIVTAAIVSLVQASRARDAERAARTELARYEEIARQFEGILAGLDPAVAQGRDQTLLLDLLESAKRRIESAKDEDAVVEATLRRTIGLAYICLGRFDEAEPELARALALREKERGANHPDTLQSLDEWGVLLLRRGRAQEALAPLQRAFDERSRQLGAQDRETLGAQANLGLAYWRAQRPAEAEPLLRAVEAARIRQLGASHVESVRATNNVAMVLSDLGRDEEARERWYRALDLHLEARGESHPDTLAALNNVAMWELDHGHPEVAEPLLARALEAKRRVLPPAHPSLVTTVNNLASVREDLGRAADAEALYQETLESIGGPGTIPETQALAFNYGSMLARMRRTAEAEMLLTEVAEAIRKTQGERARLALDADSLRAELLLDQGRADEAEPLARHVVELCDDALAPTDPGRGVFRVRYAEILRKQGRGDEAREQFKAAVDILDDLGETKWKQRAMAQLD